MALTDNIRFKQGSLAALGRQAITNGSLWFTTDEGAIYLDVNGSRVRFGDFVTVANVAALPANGHAYESALYYAKDENVLARWDADAGKWVQLNAAGLSKVKINGNGNVLSGATVTLDAETGAKVLTFSTASVATSEAMEGLQTRVKSLEDRMTAAEGKLTTIQGTGEGSIAKAVADAKADLQAKIDAVDELADKGIADAAKASGEAAKVQENLDATNVRMTTAEGKITNLENAVKDGGSVDQKIAAAKNEVLGDANSAAGSATVAGANKAAAAAQKAADDAQADADQNASDIEGLGVRMTAAEGDIDNLQDAVNTLNGGADVEGSVLNTVNEQIAAVVDGAPEAFDTLKEIAEWIGSDEANTGAAETLVNHSNRLSALESADEGFGTRMTAAEGKITALEGADTAIRSEFAAADTALEQKLMGDATAGTTLGSLQDAIESNDGEIAQLQKDVDAAEATIEGHGTRLTAAEGDISNLKSRMTQAETDIDNLEKADTAIRGEFAAADTALKNEIKGDAATYTTLGKAEDAIEANATAIEGINTQITSIQNNLTWETFE